MSRPEGRARPPPESVLRETRKVHVRIAIFHTGAEGGSLSGSRSAPSFFNISTALTFRV